MDILGDSDCTGQARGISIHGGAMAKEKHWMMGIESSHLFYPCCIVVVRIIGFDVPNYKESNTNTFNKIWLSLSTSNNLTTFLLLFKLLNLNFVVLYIL